MEIRRKFFAQKVVRHWNSLPGNVVDAPSLEAFKVFKDGWGPGQPGPLGGIPAHGSGVVARWSLRSLPTQGIPWFSDSMNTGSQYWFTGSSVIWCLTISSLTPSWPCSHTFFSQPSYSSPLWQLHKLPDLSMNLLRSLTQRKTTQLFLLC